MGDRPLNVTFDFADGPVRATNPALYSRGSPLGFIASLRDHGLRIGAIRHRLTTERDLDDIDRKRLVREMMDRHDAMIREVLHAELTGKFRSFFGAD